MLRVNYGISLSQGSLFAVVAELRKKQLTDPLRGNRLRYFEKAPVFFCARRKREVLSRPKVLVYA